MARRTTNPAQTAVADWRQTAARSLDRGGALADRLLHEIEFARNLCRLHPTKAKAWSRLIDQAQAMMDEALAGGKLDRLAKAVASAEELMAPIAKLAKSYTVHCVGHAHIDMNWMWSWPETVAITNDTFLTVLKLMDEYPDFHFTQSQASVYAIVREHNPAMLERIRDRVAEGRWEVAAVHWVEGDKNLASGESLARHLLYTRRYMRELFNLAPEDVTVDWEPDTFGHAATIPTIVARGGVRRYYMCRGGPAEKPPVFWWQGPDGSRILVNLESTWYNDHIGPHNAHALLAFCAKTQLRDWMCVYGVGDHGGGPTRRDIDRVHEMDAWPIYPTFRLAPARRFYELLEKTPERWPTLTGELNYEFTGCYTTQSQIKFHVRHAEARLLEAEAAAAAAFAALDEPYPGEPLRQGWTDTLFGHFHDILPGSGVRATRQYQAGLFQKTAATATTVKTNALRALAAQVDTHFAASQLHARDAGLGMGGGIGRGAMVGGLTTAGHATGASRPFVVFNPTGQARREVVTATLWDPVGALPLDQLRRQEFIVRRPDGGQAPAQVMSAGNYWEHSYVDFAVPVEVAPLGYASFTIEPAAQKQTGSHGYGRALDWAKGDAAKLAETVQIQSGEPAGAASLENGLLRVEIDRATGGLLRLVDKTTGVDLACAADPLAVLEYIVERPNGMSAWITGDTMEHRALSPFEVRTNQSGPYLASLSAKFKFEQSDATLAYTLRAGSPMLELALTVNWFQRGGDQAGIPALRMRFPLALTGAAGRYEIPFGSIQRPAMANQEVPANTWADVVGSPSGTAALSENLAPAGCALVNDCKHSHMLEGNVLTLKLIRASYNPDPLPEIGEHQVRLALLPHGHELSVADLMRASAVLNHPLDVLATDVHSGKLPVASAGLKGVGPENVVLAAVKKAEDEDGLVFRLVETAGRETLARLDLGKLLGRPLAALEVDLLERPAAVNSCSIAGNAVTVKLPAFGVASVLVRLTK